jgi:hypothetical protein
MLLHWRDGIEILFFAAVVYYFCRWLVQGHNTRLLYGFYLYCCIITCSYYGGFSTVGTFLVLTTPIIAILFIIFHQHSLQRNFIAPHIITPPKEPVADWLGTLMQTLLYAMNCTRKIIVFIECSFDTKLFLKDGFMVNAPFQKSLFDLLINNFPIEQHVILLINQSGKMRSIGNSFAITLEKSWIHESAQSLEHWQQQALFITEKTDALVLHVSPQTRLCTVIMQNKIVEHMDSTHAINLIRQTLEFSSSITGTAHNVATTTPPIKHQNT